MSRQYLNIVIFCIVMITSVLKYVLLITNFIICACIYGGNRTVISHFPYQVSLQFNGSHHCGGSIVDANTILTAAHCVHGRLYSKYSIRVGSTSHKKGHSFTITEIIEHPEFKGETFNKDIAIVKLDFPLTFNDKVQPIQLNENLETEFPDKTIANISGWGRTHIGIFPEYLWTTNVKLITNKKCRSIYGKKRVTSYMMCAYKSKHDACIGDSGGPLVVDGVQVGIVSWGRACAHLKYPGVYTRVAELFEWIQKNKNLKKYYHCPRIDNN